MEQDAEEIELARRRGVRSRVPIVSEIHRDLNVGHGGEGVGPGRQVIESEAVAEAVGGEEEGARRGQRSFALGLRRVKQNVYDAAVIEHAPNVDEERIHRRLTSFAFGGIVESHVTRIHVAEIERDIAGLELEVGGRLHRRAEFALLDDPPDPGFGLIGHLFRRCTEGYERNHCQSDDAGALGNPMPGLSAWVAQRNHLEKLSAFSRQLSAKERMEMTKKKLPGLMVDR